MTHFITFPNPYNRACDIFFQPEDAAFVGKDTITAEFVSGHLRNNLMAERSFLYVERLTNSSNFQQKIEEAEQAWEIVFVDTDWETKIEWCRTNIILGESTVEIQWTIPNDTETGVYRIRHEGFYKASFKFYKASIRL